MIRRILKTLATTAIMAAVTPAIADAHLGDWSQQFTATRYRASITCGTGSPLCVEPSRVRPGQIPGCYGATDGDNPCYAGSGRYGDHSRWFVWRYLESSPLFGTRMCIQYMRIGHTNSIFYDSRTCN